MFRVVYSNKYEQKSRPKPQPRPKKKKAPTIDLSSRLLVNTRELQAMLGLGRPLATEIGEQAGAKIMLGRKIMWNPSAVRMYLDSIAKAQRPILLR